SSLHAPTNRPRMPSFPPRSWLPDNVVVVIPISKDTSPSESSFFMFGSSSLVSPFVISFLACRRPGDKRHQARTQNANSHAVSSPDQDIGLLRFERSHIDGEAVLHIGLEKSLVGFIDLLDGDDFDIGGDVMCAAEIEHLLGLGDAADERAGETMASEQKAHCSDGERLRRRADEGEVAVAAEELDIRVNVMIGGDGVE